MEKIVENLDRNDKYLSKIEEDLSRITKEVAEMAPISVEPTEVESQLQEVEEIQVELAEDKQCLESVQDSLEWLVIYAKPEPDLAVEMRERVTKVQYFSSFLKASISGLLWSLYLSQLGCQNVNYCFSKRT